MAPKNVFFCLVATTFWTVSIIKGEPMRVPYETVSTKAANVQEEIVGKHNTLRRGVIPKARNMLKMGWNENAAQNARNWSEECKREHSPQFKRTLTESLCGENLLFASHPLSWSDVIQMWYDESENFTYGSGPTQPESVVGHYTQTVWATSYMIGCGVAHCPNQETFKYFYTCHYCHGGNNRATFTTPYKKGIPCGDCPGQCEDGLCTNPCPYTDAAINCPDVLRVLKCNHKPLRDSELNGPFGGFIFVEIAQACPTWNLQAASGLPKDLGQPTKNGEDVKESTDVMSVLSLYHLTCLLLVTIMSVM